MSVYLISYDLKGRDETAADYQRLIKAIKDKVGEGNYAKVLYSQFFVDSNMTSDEWNSFISEQTDENDARLIVRVESFVVGKFNKDTIAWLERRGL